MARRVDKYRAGLPEDEFGARTAHGTTGIMAARAKIPVGGRSTSDGLGLGASL